MNADFETALQEFEAEQVNEKQALEFVVDESFIKRLPEIISNLEAIKGAIIERTETDRNLVLVTDEDFDKARKRCADLNKINAQIDEERKRVKKEYIKPYELFESKVKEVTGIITAAKENLWGQITAAENAVKERKENEYKAYYAEKGAFAAEYRTWEQIFNKSWLNKGYSADKVCKEIDEIISEIASDIDTIDNLNSEFAPALYEKYKSGATLKEVVAYNVALNASKNAVEQRKANTATTESQTEENAADESVEPETGYIVKDFRVYCTKSQLDALKEFLILHKIKYGRVPKGE